MANRSVFYVSQANHANNLLVFCLALVAHGLLLLVLCFGVQWHSQPLSGLEAEIWTELPVPDAAVSEQTATQPAIEEPTQEKADIAITTPRQSKAVHEKPKSLPTAVPGKNKEDKQKTVKSPEKQVPDDTLQRLQKLRAEQDRAAQLARSRRLAQESSGSGGMTGSASGSGDPGLASYKEKVNRAVSRNFFLDKNTVVGNPKTVVQVQLAPDGRVLNKHIITSSGNKAWDDEALRAIERSSPLPKDVDGKARPSFSISFDPKSMFRPGLQD